MNKATTINSSTNTCGACKTEYHITTLGNNINNVKIVISCCCNTRFLTSEESKDMMVAVSKRGVNV